MNLFLHPQILWALALLPLLALWLGRKGARPAVTFSNIETARDVARVTRSRWGRFLGIARWVGLALLIVGLARPQIGHASTEVQASGIDLVLAGVIDVDDIDRAVSLGPGLGWAAAGPHLTYHLGAGDEGVKGFLDQLLQSFESWWASLAQWTKLEQEQVQALTGQIERAYGGKLDVIREARDRRLAAILEALEQARKG